MRPVFFLKRSGLGVWAELDAGVAGTDGLAFAVDVDRFEYRCFDDLERRKVGTPRERAIAVQSSPVFPNETHENLTYAHMLQLYAQSSAWMLRKLGAGAVRD